MGHDTSKVLLGSGCSSAKEVSVYNSDPATYYAGLAVRQGASEGVLSVLKSVGMLCGISLGKSLSDHKKTNVARTGELIPARLTLKRATGVVTITSYANLVSGTDDVLSVAGVDFTAQAGAATPGDATFRAATGNTETALSLATQINAHATASLKVYAVAALAVVTLYAVTEGVGSTGTGNDVAVAYTDNDTNVGLTLSGLSAGKLSGGSDTISDIAYVTKGAKAYVNDFTGKFDIAMSGFSTISDGMYNSGVLTGIDEAGSSVAAALVDITGGL